MSAAAEPGGEQGTRVLVIDDEEIVHASVGRILARAGYQADAVFSAQEGIDRLAGGTYQLVITDLMMPGMNGIEMLQEFKQRQLQVPVVMITGYPTIRTALQAMRLGAMDYLAKPFTRKELLSPVMRALRQDPAEAEQQVSLGDSPQLDAASLLPGAELYLPHHAWIRFQQDGLFQVGVEPSFLSAVGQVSSLAPPEPMDLLEQGVIGLRLNNEQGEEHGVAMPLTGQVSEVNLEVMAEPSKIKSDTWLLKVLPSALKEELSNLVLRSRGG